MRRNSLPSLTSLSSTSESDGDVDLDLDLGYSSQSFGSSLAPIELYKKDPGEVSASLGGARDLEANLWLPFASKHYRLSPNLQDYVLVPVPSMFSEIPNTNGDSVTMGEFLEFKPTLGMQAFKTFRGKPTYVEHDNQDITKARGVILDVFLRPLRRFGGGKYYKLVLLLGYDRSKDPLLVNSILTGEKNAYSVGFYFKAYKCSICGLHVGKGGVDYFCDHTKPRRPTYRDGSGRLVYRQCIDITGFECSQVHNPAFSIAVGPHVINTFDFMSGRTT
jgi:hypothetical protein